jgi:hypothetical protein
MGVGSGMDFIPILGTTGLSVCPVSRSDQPRIFAEATNKLQNLKPNMSTVIELSLEDS